MTFWIKTIVEISSGIRIRSQLNNSFQFITNPSSQVRLSRLMYTYQYPTYLHQFNNEEAILRYENKINRAIENILGEQPTNLPLPPNKLFQDSGPSMPQINQTATVETKVPKSQEIATGIFR